ncbi:MAG: hypothetical protein LAT57_07045 [Balneolales bacterium]|nr:hypothetical protein [Balneolales bacterium]
MNKLSRLNIILLLSIVVTAYLHVLIEPAHEKQFESWNELDELIIRHIQDYGHPAQRVRLRSVEVNDRLTRRIITVDIDPSYTQTDFHRQLQLLLRPYGAKLYATVEFPERISTIHVLFDGTVARTIRFQRVDTATL